MRDVRWWAATAVLSGVAFGVGQGVRAGLIVDGLQAVLVTVLHLRRKRTDAVRGARDERNQRLAAGATAAASGMLAMIMTRWLLISAATGAPNTTLMIVLGLYLVIQVATSAYFARRG